MHTCRENWRVMHLYLHADVVSTATSTLHSGKVEARDFLPFEVCNSQKKQSGMTGDDSPAVRSDGNVRLLERKQ